MNNKAKIHLSKYEIEVVTDTLWILTKQSITEKIFFFFGEMHELYKSLHTNLNSFFDEFHFIKNGKISKGENYLGLPYVILDYPASFEKNNLFMIRTMFWWGNFFSITLHISGYERMQKLNLKNLLSYLKEKNFFVCINEDEWHHNFETTNYLPAIEMYKKDWAEVRKKKFFKISKKIELAKWAKAPEFLEKTFGELIEIINISFPVGEKVP